MHATPCSRHGVSDAVVAVTGSGFFGLVAVRFEC